MSQQEREAKIKANSAKLIEKATKNTHYDATVEPFYYGNQYFLFVYEKFRDIRLVAAPLVHWQIRRGHRQLDVATSYR